MAKLSYITLFVKDIEVVKDWYVKYLGLSILQESPDFVLLQGQGGAQLGLHRGEPLSRPEQVNLHFEVEDVDAEYKRLKSQGLRFSQAPQTMPWGYRTAYVQDPAGHTVEIYMRKRE